MLNSETNLNTILSSMGTIIIDPDGSGGIDFALLDSSSSVSVLSRDSETENADSTVVLNDQLEGTIYRTQVSESKISISFLSRIFFDMFLKKIHSDFQQSVEKDETTFKC